MKPDIGGYGCLPYVRPGTADRSKQGARRPWIRDAIADSHECRRRSYLSVVSASSQYRTTLPRFAVAKRLVHLRVVRGVGGRAACEFKAGQ